MRQILEQRRQKFAEQLKRFLNDESAKSFLRDYQQLSLEKTLIHVADAHETSGFIEAPAGSGKTKIISALVQAMNSHGGEKSPPRIIVVEPSIGLVEQTRDKIKEQFPDLPVGVYYHEEKDLEQAITVVTQDSFYKLIQQGLITPENTDMLLIDEAHRILSDPRREIVEKFKPSTLIFGCTASSEFDEVKGVYRALGKQIHRITDKELVEAKPTPWLCPRANIIAEFKVPQVTGDSETKKKAEEKAYTDTALGLYLGYRDKETEDEPILGQQGLIYAYGVKHAEKIVDRFNSDPHVRSALQKITGNPNIVPATLVHGGLSKTALKRCFKDFEEGRTHILVGDQIFIEGIDLPTAAWEMRRAGESKVEAVQAGGRVSRLDGNNPAKTGRVFNLYTASSNIKEPVFHTDVLGTSRLGKIQADISLYRHDLPQGVDTLPLPKDIVVHNSEFEVQRFLRGIRPERKRSAVTTFMPAATMAGEIGAWPQEVERIYDILKANYQHASKAQEFVDVGGRLVKKSMMKDVNGLFVLDSDAKPVIADIVTPLALEGSAFLTENNVLERLEGSQGVDGVKALFADLASKYPQQYLESKYPLSGTAQKPSSEIISHGLPVSLGSLARVQTDSGVALGVHEDVFDRLWHQHIPEKTTSDMSFSEAAKLLGVTSKNSRFKGIWESIQHQYDTHPFPAVRVDNETIESGKKHTLTGTHFYTDKKHLGWFNKQLGRKLGEKNPDWLERDEMFGRQYGYRSTERTALWEKIHARFDASPSEPVVIDGHTVECGYAQAKGYTPFCLHKNETEWFENKALENKRLFKQKREEGALTIQEAADQFQSTYIMAYKRARKINANDDYTPTGVPSAQSQPPFVKGSELVWRRAGGNLQDGEGILISPKLVQGWKKIIEQQKKLRGEGYKTIDEVSKSLEFDRSTIEARLSKYRPDEFYSPEGLDIPTDVHSKIQGNMLVWRDPFGFSNGTNILIHPQLATAWEKAEAKDNELKKAGYKTYSEAAQISGVARESLEMRAAVIEPEKTYNFENETKNITSLTGSQLVWKNPYSAFVLLHPAMVNTWKTLEEKDKTVRENGYNTIAEMAEITGMDEGAIRGRLGNISPSGVYAPNGLLADDKTAEKITGGDLVWNGFNQLFIHPGIAAAWKIAEEKKRELLANGYKKSGEIKQSLKLKKASVLARAAQINPDQNYSSYGLAPVEGEPVIKGNELIWRNPYAVSSDTSVLFHPQLIEGWLNNEEKELPCGQKSI